MAGKRCAVHEQGIAANPAIVADMGVGQNKVPVAQRCSAATLSGAAVDGNVLAENIAVARDQFGALAAKRVILRVATDGTERVEHVVLAEPRWATQYGMFLNNAAVAQLNFFADHGISADFDTFSEPGTCRNNSLRVDLAFGHFAGFVA